MDYPRKSQPTLHEMNSLQLNIVSQFYIKHIIVQYKRLYLLFSFYLPSYNVGLCKLGTLPCQLTGASLRVWLPLDDSPAHSPFRFYWQRRRRVTAKLHKSIQMTVYTYSVLPAAALEHAHREHFILTLFLTFLKTTENKTQRTTVALITL